MQEQQNDPYSVDASEGRASDARLRWKVIQNLISVNVQITA